MRRYEYIGGKSAKYWEIHREATDVVVSYGRIGHTGRKVRKSFPNEAEARIHVERSVKKKLKKGYALAGKTDEDAPKEANPNDTSLPIGRLPKLPTNLRPFSEALENAALPFVPISFRSTKRLRPAGSRLGGPIFLPEGEALPRDSKGRLLGFLAQVNWSEVPDLLGYPRDGLTQFFIARDDALGIFSRGRARHQVRHYGVVPKGEMVPFHSAYFNSPDWNSSPLYFEAEGRAIKFGKARYEYPSNRDVRAERILRSETELYDELSDASGSKIGGYAFFTQQDPRPSRSPALLLLQLDTCDELMWGDSGVGHFFIKKQDLSAGRLENATYNWDCC